MRYFPVFMDVAEQPIVVVGEGEKAAQKLRLLAKTDAQITVVGPEPSAEIVNLADAGAVTLVRDGFRDEQLRSARFVISANDCPVIDLAVAEAARSKNTPINVVDRPAESTFIVPALVDRDPVVVAIGTEGTAPILAREVKSRLEAMLPSRFGNLAHRAGALRERVGREIVDPQRRRRFWEGLLRGRWRDAILSGDSERADVELTSRLSATLAGDMDFGRVSLVGAGPGEPDLLTLKAQQRLQDADVIIVDGLVAPRILEYARRDAERIAVGKKGYGAATDQATINGLLVREAARGRNVVRLKAGDPLVFGRAAEEMAAIRAAGIPVDIVPGVTAAHACAASIGLPITLREKVREFSVVTGATVDGVPDLDWAAMARPGQASAVYMGVRSAPLLQSRLLSAGAAPDLPVIIVENGTRDNERVVATTLSALPAAMTAKAIKGPAILFIGLSWAAAHLSPPEHVEWFEAEPQDVVQDADNETTGKSEPRAWTPQDIANATMWVAG
ncbi:MAG: siroheme synthase CysG [Pseudomonadota bacterium]